MVVTTAELLKTVYYETMKSRSFKETEEVVAVDLTRLGR